MRTHIKVVGWLYAIYCALGLLGAAGMLFGGFLGGLASGSIPTLLASSISGAVLAIIFGFLSLLGLIAAFAFMSHRPWARYVLILVAILKLFSWPLGTLFGVYALWVLFNRDTEAIFRAQEAMAA